MSAPPIPAGDVAGALLEVAGGVADSLVVAAPEHPAAAALRAAAPERLVAVAGGLVRAAVATGVALAGRRVVVLLDGEVPARLPLEDLPAGAGIVAVTIEARVAGACWGAGWTLVQPAWPADVPVLLGEALAGGLPAVLHLPAGAPGSAGARPAPGVAREGAPDAGVARPRFGVPRVLREGTAGLLAASGAGAVTLLVEVARQLAERGVAVQALDLHTAAPGEGPGPVGGASLLLAADRPVPAGSLDGGRWPEGLRPVPVLRDPRGAMEAVAAHLRVHR